MVRLTRRAMLGTSAAATIAAAFGWPAAAQESQPPILFVHGAGDDASIWYTVFWRFETNGYDPHRLFAIDFTNSNPARPEDYGKSHPGRSTTAEQLIELAAKIDEVKHLTGEDRLVLVAHSRGGNAVRNYIKNTSGVSSISTAILCASPNHGIFASNASEQLLSEFNNWGYFLRQLNHGPTEATPGVRFLTIRSDKNDRWYQPVLPPTHPAAGGRSGVPSNIGYDSPELTGANNIVLPGLDHKEVARHPLAFREMYRFITGKGPERLDVMPEAQLVLDGKVTGLTTGLPTNLPMADAEVEIFEVSAETGARIGQGPVYRRTTGADGRWGPFAANPQVRYEFVLTVPDYPVEHIYCTPFPRSSAILNLRPRSFAESDKGAPGSVITAVRRNGNLARDRDTVLVDGQVPPSLQGSPPQDNETTLRVDAQGRRPAPVIVNGERLVVQTWLARDNHIVVAEVHY